jgi:uncharacterized protein YndB with AHSA1/START domain
MKKNGYTVYHNFLVKSDKKSVFEAFSDPVHLVNWWPQRCSGEAKLGCVYNLFFTEEFHWMAEVVRNDPPTSFQMRMLKSDDDWNPTTFGIDLEERGDAVYVRFFHKDWPRCNDHFKFSSFCWALLLKGMKDYVEKGEVVSFEERA